MKRNPSKPKQKRRVAYMVFTTFQGCDPPYAETDYFNLFFQNDRIAHIQYQTA